MKKLAPIENTDQKLGLATDDCNYKKLLDKLKEEPYIGVNVIRTDPSGQKRLQKVKVPLKTSIRTPVSDELRSMLEREIQTAAELVEKSSKRNGK
jgi:hypothetical protein